MANGNTLPGWRDPYNRFTDPQTTDGEGAVGRPVDLGIADDAFSTKPNKIADPYNLSGYDFQQTDGEGSSGRPYNARLFAFATYAAMYPSKDQDNPDHFRISPEPKGSIKEILDITDKKAVA